MFIVEILETADAMMEPNGEWLWSLLDTEVTGTVVWSADECDIYPASPKFGKCKAGEGIWEDTKEWRKFMELKSGAELPGTPRSDVSEAALTGNLDIGNVLDPWELLPLSPWVAYMESCRARPCWV